MEIGYLSNQEYRKGVERQTDIDFVKENVAVYLRKITNWNAPDPEGLHGL